MLRRVALVRTDVSEELSASIIRVTRIGEVGTTLVVTSNRHTLRRNNIAEDDILHSDRSENLTSYKTGKFVLYLHLEDGGRILFRNAVPIHQTALYQEAHYWTVLTLCSFAGAYFTKMPVATFRPDPLNAVQIRSPVVHCSVRVKWSEVNIR
jgi:hypothetical protein